MKTIYYRIEDSHKGAYDFHNDGVILAVRGDKEWLLTDNWCGSGVEGECYRHHIDGKRKSWPKASEKAINKINEFEEYFAGCEYPVFAAELEAKTIRNILKV